MKMDRFFIDVDDNGELFYEPNSKGDWVRYKDIEHLLSTPSESGGEVYKSKAEAWDMICKLCPHNQDGIANCCVSMQDDYCHLMRDMRQTLNGNFAPSESGGEWCEYSKDGDTTVTSCGNHSKNLSFVTNKKYCTWCRKKIRMV